MSQHIFILHSDLTRLACDVWLMPCDLTFTPLRHWYADAVPRLETSETDHDRLRRVTQWPENRPVPLLTNVGISSRAMDQLTAEQLSWLADGARAFIRAGAALARERPFLRRGCPLLALPVIGTGAGGASRRIDQVLAALLPALQAEAETHGVDVALVAYDGLTYAAAQQVRGRHAGWAVLSHRQREHADRLAALARRERLALFLGAGVSMGAGAPSWGALLADLAGEAGLGEAERQALKGMDYLDRASLLAARFGGSGALRRAVAERMGAFRFPSVSHALLAALPVGEVVTQNYDVLFEEAAAASGRKAAVLPYEPAGGDRWLLKMHGCVSHPDDIVLERADYLRYGQRRDALRGIVQAALITRHMLFVGFSLNDGNFLQVADDVRQALGAARPDRFGSVVTLTADPFFTELWERELHVLPMADDGADGARRLEIWLDYVAAETASRGAFLLDTRFRHLLSPEEEALAQALGPVAALVGEKRDGEAYRPVADLLRRLGWDG